MGRERKKKREEGGKDGKKKGGRAAFLRLTSSWSLQGEGRNVSMTTVILTTQDSMTDSDPCSSSVVVTLADLGGQGLRSPQQLLCEPLEKLEQPWFF